MKTEQWKTYRTRFLVKAKQLSSALSFTDHLGRQHVGRKGDYLVESCDGVLSIAPRQIFQDVYVAMAGHDAASDSIISEAGQPFLEILATQSDEMGEVEPRAFFRPTPARRRTDPIQPRARRKSPQPVRANRSPAHATLM